MKKFLEKDLEEIIFNSNRDELEKRGLYIEGNMFRQLKIGNYGIADLVSFYRTSEIIDDEISQSIEITIYELKKDKIGISAFLQAIRYARGIQRYIEARNEYINFDIDVVLIGDSIDNSGSFCFLSDLIGSLDTNNAMSSLSFYTYDYKIDGLHFTEQTGYQLIKEGFKLGGRNE